VEFGIYYGDGSVYDGPIDGILCSDNVQAIAWDDLEKGNQTVGRVVLQQWDIYIYSDPIGWHGTNKYADLLMHLGKGIGIGGVRAVLTGGWIDRADYQSIIKRAETDGMRKSAIDPVREDGSE